MIRRKNRPALLRARSAFVLCSICWSATAYTAEEDHREHESNEIAVFIETMAGPELSTMDALHSIARRKFPAHRFSFHRPRSGANLKVILRIRLLQIRDSSLGIVGQITRCLMMAALQKECGNCEHHAFGLR